MHRAIKDLNQLSDTDLFEEVAAGVGYVVEAVDRLDAAARKLSEAGDHHPAWVLRTLAEEEAAKVLILVDAVRCPRNSSNNRSRVLGYFNNHVAKGIYAEVCGWQPVDFAELARGVEDEQASHYIDGPEGVDWVFPNRIGRRRTDVLYVDYCREDHADGRQGMCYWVYPRDDLYEALPFWASPMVIRIARALHQVGATTPAGLGIVAEIWRPIEVRPEMRFDELERLNLQTLKKLEMPGLPAESSSDVYALVRDRWPFPLWSLDLGERKLKKDELREIWGAERRTFYDE